MTSTYIKAALLNYLRFAKRVPYVATEVGRFSADVAAICKSTLTEYEVKVSLSDFKADFAKEKHQLFEAQSTGQMKLSPRWSPHYFYFVTTPELVEEIGSRLITKPLYGLMVATPVKYQGQLREAVKVVKRAKMLHKGVIHQSVYEDFLYRMGSELASLHNFRLNKNGLIE